MNPPITIRVTTKNTSPLNTVNTSDIQTLTKNSDDLARSIDRWSDGYVWLGAVALLVAFLVFFAQWRIIKKGKDLSSVQSELIAAKDRAAASDSQTKDERIAEANLGAATAQKHAAEANRRAEAEKIAHLELERQVAPRTLDDSSRKTIAEKLALFAVSFKGRNVTIKSQTGDAESIIFAVEIMDILTRAGISVDQTGIGRMMPVGDVYMGVLITGPSSDEPFISSFVKEIKVTEPGARGESKPEWTQSVIFVGVKSIKGVPIDLMPR